MTFDDVKSALDYAMRDIRTETFMRLIQEKKDLENQVADLKTEVGRLEALLADKKPESECECCKCRDESEPTLKDLYELGKYLVDTVDEIESIHIQVVRTRKKEEEDDE